MGAHAEGVLNRYETYRSEIGGGFDPVAAWVRANADKGVETLRDMVPVAGSLAKAAGGLKIDDQQFPATPQQMTKVEKAVELAKAAVELAIIVVAGGLEARAGSGSALKTEAGAAPENAANMARRTAAEQIRLNKMQGDAFEEAVLAERKATMDNLVRRITVETESGARTCLDLVGNSKATGSVGVIEAKSSATARLSKAQGTAFPGIEQSGATVVGEGKLPFVGGTRIPPTKVEVVRPNQ